MSKSNAFEAALLDLIFLNTAIPGIAAALGAPGDLYVSLHDADPGEAGDQTTNECDYTGYERVAVPRSAAGFTRTGSSISPTDPVAFPVGTAGGAVPATHFGIGTALSGAGALLYSGPLTPNVMTGVGVAPVLDTATTITED